MRCCRCLFAAFKQAPGSAAPCLSALPLAIRWSAFTSRELKRTLSFLSGSLRDQATSAFQGTWQWEGKKVEKPEGKKAVACAQGMVHRPGVDDFQYLSGAHEIEHLLHGRSGIHQPHDAIPAADQIADSDQRGHTGAIHEPCLG